MEFIRPISDNTQPNRCRRSRGVSSLLLACSFLCSLRHFALAALALLHRLDNPNRHRLSHTAPTTHCQTSDDNCTIMPNLRWTYFFLYRYIILIFKGVNKSIGTNVCRCNWLDYAGSLGWPFPMLKYKYIKYIFQIKFVKAIISLTAVGNFLFNILKMRIAVKAYPRCTGKVAIKRV